MGVLEDKLTYFWGIEPAEPSTLNAPMHAAVKKRCVNGDQLRVFQYYLQNESEDPTIEGVMINCMKS